MDSDSSIIRDDQDFVIFKSCDLLIAIDSNEEMFKPLPTDPNGPSLFKLVIQSCYDMVDRHMMRGTKANRICVVIVAEDQQKMTICDFKDYLPNALKSLQKLLENSEDDLKSQFLRGKICFGDFLFNVKNKFKEVMHNNSRKYLAFITNDDDPVSNDQQLIYKAINQAKTFTDFHIEFELLTFKEEFDCNLFFKDLLISMKGVFNYEYLTDMVCLEDKLTTWFTLRGKRSKFYLYPDSDSAFEVIEKSYIKKRKILNNVHVEKDTLEEVVKVFKKTESGFLPGRYSLNYNSEFYAFSQEEKDIYNNDKKPNGFTLIGISAGLIEDGMQLSNPKFIHENKEKPTPFFNMLWEYCIKKNKVLICLRKYNKNSASNLFELQPKFINNTKSFLLVKLTFSNNIRKLTINNVAYNQKETDNDKLMEAAEKLVNALTFDYNPLQFHNTVKCRMWEYARSQLMEEPTRNVSDIIDLKIVQGSEVDEVVAEFKSLMSFKRKETKQSGSRSKRGRR